MNWSSTLIPNGKSSQLAVFLAILMITPQIATLVTEPTHLVADSRAEASEEIESKLYTPVSYTHLTLPTIYSV